MPLLSLYNENYTNYSWHALNIYIIVTDMEGNVRIYKLLKGRGPYHDPRAVCLS
jgi:hypothetical protein